jgi:hypothetical protein
MRRSSLTGLRTLAFLSILTTASATALADEREWTDLIGKDNFDAWTGPTGEWFVAGNARLDPANPKRLKGEDGSGVIINGPTGRTKNLVTKDQFGDVEVHLEFLVPKGSNSGIKLQGVYEIQIYDSWGVKTPKGSDCGGIYPRAELKPKYHHIDEGYAPRENASLPPGEWQTLDLIFQAPRFDAEGKKVASARFVKVALNGKAVHEDVEVPTPTGNNWKNKETPKGPILLQADHGPVAFRNIRVRAR